MRLILCRHKIFDFLTPRNVTSLIDDPLGVAGWQSVPTHLWLHWTGRASWLSAQIVQPFQFVHFASTSRPDEDTGSLPLYSIPFLTTMTEEEDDSTFWRLFFSSFFSTKLVLVGGPKIFIRLDSSFWQKPLRNVRGCITITYAGSGRVRGLLRTKKEC